MESREIRDLIESYYSVYNESIAMGSRPDSRSSSGSSGGSGGILDRVVDTATSVVKPQVQKQANKKFGPLGGIVAGAEVDKIGSDVKSGNYGGALDRAVKGAGKLFNSVDMFDIVKGHLLDEGYADTEQAALAIMANMSEQWKQSIIEDVDAQGNRSHDLFTDKPNPKYNPTSKPPTKKPQPTIKKGPPMRDEPLF